MPQEDSPIESSIVSLEVFDLHQENFIDLHNVFSVAKLPVSKENMATQHDATRVVFLAKVKAVFEMECRIAKERSKLSFHHKN